MELWIQSKNLRFGFPARPTPALERYSTLIDEDMRQKVILHFGNVEYLSSAALGKLITLDKKAKAAKAQLRLCDIKPEIYEVFAITKLNKLFKIHDDLEKALASF